MDFFSVHQRAGRDSTHLLMSPRHSLESIRSNSSVPGWLPGSDKLAEALRCPICLEIAQLPVNLTCFRGCQGTEAMGATTCLRSLVCAHCANRALTLLTPPESRVAPPGGPPPTVRCLICRSTTVPTPCLTPPRAYAFNHNVMEIMDLLGFKAACRKCGELAPNQASLMGHYLRKCPHAVVKCKHPGCNYYAVRPVLGSHEYTCPVGRSRCSQCGLWVDASSLAAHMSDVCRQRWAECMVCGIRCRLPELLPHLNQHRAALQTQLCLRTAAEAAGAVPGGLPATAATPQAVAGGASPAAEGLLAQGEDLEDGGEVSGEASGEEVAGAMGVLRPQGPPTQAATGKANSAVSSSAPGPALAAADASDLVNSTSGRVLAPALWGSGSSSGSGASISGGGSGHVMGARELSNSTIVSHAVM